MDGRGPHSCCQTRDAEHRGQDPNPKRRTPIAEPASPALLLRADPGRRPAATRRSSSSRTARRSSAEPRPLARGAARWALGEKLVGRHVLREGRHVFAPIRALHAKRPRRDRSQDPRRSSAGGGRVAPHAIRPPRGGTGRSRRRRDALDRRLSSPSQHPGIHDGAVPSGVDFANSRYDPATSRSTLQTASALSSCSALREHVRSCGRCGRSNSASPLGKPTSWRSCSGGRSRAGRAKQLVGGRASEGVVGRRSASAPARSTRSSCSCAAQVFASKRAGRASRCSTSSGTPTRRAARIPAACVAAVGGRRVAGAGPAPPAAEAANAEPEQLAPPSAASSAPPDVTPGGERRIPPRRPLAVRP